MSDYPRDPAPVYSHVLRGWGGFVKMFEDMAAERVKMDECHLNTLKGYVARMMAVIEAQEKLP